MKRVAAPHNRRAKGSSKWLQTFHRIWRSRGPPGAQQRIIIGRDNAKRPPPTFISPLPFNRFFNRVTRTNRFLHLLIEARASGPSSWMGNREEDATWSRIKRRAEESRGLRLIEVLVKKEERGMVCINIGIESIGKRNG